MSHELDRRSVLGLALAGGAAVSIPGLLSACAADTTSTPTSAPASSVPTSGAATPSASAAGYVFPADVNAKWPQITSKEVVVANFGGESQDVRREDIYTPFTELTGANVVDATWDYGKFMSMVNAPDPEWDTIDFDGYSVVGLILGGTPPAKLADWVRRCDMVDPEYQDYCGGGYAYSIVMGWAPSLSGTPETWADFWNTAKYPGKRAFPKSVYLGTVEAALLADGVSKDALYPLDFDRAFAKLDELKKDMIFYDSAAQGQQMVAQGSASMMLTANSKMLQLQDQGVGDFTYNQAILYPWSAFPITLHSKNMDAVNALIDAQSHPAVQAEVARRIRSGPVQSAAFELLDDATIAQLPNSPENMAMSAVVDTKAAAQQDGEYVERFYGWVGQ